jgi:transcriptional regulator with XRE-family HTH domain
MLSELEAWRIGKGLTQQQLADMAGVSVSTVDRAESGDCGKRSARLIEAVTGIKAGKIMDPSYSPSLKVEQGETTVRVGGETTWTNAQ